MGYGDFMRTDTKLEFALDIFNTVMAFRDVAMSLLQLRHASQYGEKKENKKNPAHVRQRLRLKPEETY